MVKCKICGKEFERAKQLPGHMKTHPVKSRVVGVFQTELERRTPLPARAKFDGPMPKGDPEVLNPGEVASELLRLVIDKLNKETNYLNQIAALKEQNLDLDSKLRKAREEAERTIKIHNKIVEQSNAGILPTVEDVVRVLRRQDMESVPRMNKLGSLVRKGGK